VPAQGADATPSPSLAAYGCRMNDWSVDELFRRYEMGGFLDPTKKGRLVPYWGLVKDNWSRALASPDGLVSFVSYEGGAGQWAVVGNWRTTDRGWARQHLVSTDPRSARQVLLAALGQDIHAPEHHSNQLWYQPSKRMPQEVFGAIQARCGRDQAAVHAYSYLALPLSQPLPGPGGVSVRQLPSRRSAALAELVRSARGQVYLSAEGLDGEDLNLEGLDDLYRRAGLRRYRRAYVAEIDGWPELAGALIVYRGPLGLNFSFLENRAEVMTAPGLPDWQAALVATALVTAARPAYADFEPGYVPVVAADREVAPLLEAGAALMRRYSQAIALKAGYAAVYDHLRTSFDQRARQAGERNGNETA
jgi:hypothetical protein